MLITDSDLLGGLGLELGLDLERQSVKLSVINALLI